MSNQQRLEYLFQRYLDRLETPTELDELMELIEDQPNKEHIQELLDAARHHLAGTAHMSNEQTERIFASIFQKAEAPAIKTIQSGGIKRLWWRISAAASILVLVSAGSYFLFFNQPPKPQAIVQSTPSDIAAPALNKATVRLANGQLVYLDSAANGTLSSVGNVRLTKLANGRIAYSGNATEVMYNTLTNPRGSKVIDMTLADGSRLWLNAGSSVTYPVAFTGNERKVTLEGEAYFEVAHNAAMPFRVSKGNMVVTVLGTHFNVNAYDDETDIRVTLLEGSVQVNNGPAQRLLQPGQQAQVKEDIKVVSDADLDAVMAWKNGLFSFTDASLETVMRQLARWYDVEVRYEGVIPEREFNGEIGKTLTLDQVLKVLTRARVNYIIENGNRITIMP